MGLILKNLVGKNEEDVTAMPDVEQGMGNLLNKYQVMKSIYDSSDPIDAAAFSKQAVTGDTVTTGGAAGSDVGADGGNNGNNGQASRMPGPATNAPLPFPDTTPLNQGLIGKAMLSYADAGAEAAGSEPFAGANRQWADTQAAPMNAAQGKPPAAERYELPVLQKAAYSPPADQSGLPAQAANDGAAATPNAYPDYSLASKDGMRKFLDDKAWQYRSGQPITAEEMRTVKTIASSYFGFEGKPDSFLGAWENLTMPQVDRRYDFYTTPEAGSAAAFQSPKFGPQALSDVVSPYSRRVLDTIATAADLDTQDLIATSTQRSAADQARIMFEQLRSKHISNYGKAGQAVIARYHALNGKNYTDAQIKADMADTIQALVYGGSEAFDHVNDPSVKNTFDIAPSSIPIAKRAAFEAALNEAQKDGSIDFYHGPNTAVRDPAYHIVITQPRTR